MEQLYTLDKSCIFCGERENIHLTVRMLKTNEGLKTFQIWLCIDHFSISTKEIQEIIGEPINLNNL